MNARFVKNPITGLENDALLVDGMLFDVVSIWYACDCDMSFEDFYNISPDDMAKIALELFEAGLIGTTV